MDEVRILGAGVSGLTSAINLARAGYKVRVFERNRDVGYRFGGDLQGLENWSSKKDVVDELWDMGIKTNFDHDPFDSLFITNTEKSSHLASEKPFFYLVKRGPFKGSLDYGLKEQALDFGVEIEFHRRAKPDEVDIVAGGSIPQKIPMIAKGFVFETDHRDVAVMVLKNDLAHKGYSYLLVTKGYGCMCSVVADELHRVSACLEKTRHFFTESLDLRMRSTRPVGGVGSFSTSKVYERDGRLYVGEAAGLQDFLWGFGMRLSMQSGHLAAQCYMKGRDYGTLARKKFDKRSKASFVNRYLWEKAGEKDYIGLVSNPGLVKRNLHSFHSHNMVQRLLHPAAAVELRKTYPHIFKPH